MVSSVSASLDYIFAAASNKQEKWQWNSRSNYINVVFVRMENNVQSSFTHLTQASHLYGVLTRSKAALLWMNPVLHLSCQDSSTLPSHTDGKQVG